MEKNSQRGYRDQNQTNKDLILKEESENAYVRRNTYIKHAFSTGVVSGEVNFRYYNDLWHSEKLKYIKSYAVYL